MCKKLVVLTVVLSLLFALPAVNAHMPPWEIPTWCYVVASPNPIGVNQQVCIVFWINSYPPTAEGAYGDRWTFDVEITKPDGSKEAFKSIKSDPVGGGYIVYTPTQIGNYTIIAKFLGHKITGLPLYPGRTLRTITGAAYVNDTFLPSTSEPYILQVRSEPIEMWREAPLPSNYWTRPIYGANRNWWTLAANWLGDYAQRNGSTTSFQWGLGPESPHIMWAASYWDGGIMDARFQDDAYYQGLSYEVYWSPPIVLNGRLYYNVRTPPRYGWWCIDLYTGEKLYFKNTTGPVILGSSTYNPALGEGYIQRADALRTDTSGAIQIGQLSFGQILAYHSPNQHGGLPYLWSTSGPTADTWMMFDAYTGNYICSIKNVPSGTIAYGKDGSILIYRIVNLGTSAAPKYYLQVWNSTHAIQENIPWLRNWYWCWRPILGYTFDGNKGFFLNVSIPVVRGTVRAFMPGEYVIGGTSGKKNATYTEPGQLWALSLKRGEEGKLLWNITFIPPETIPDNAFPSGIGVDGPIVIPEYNVFLFRQRVTRQWWGYNLANGQKLWGPSEPESQFNYYGMSYNVYKGKLITWGYGGELRAYNITTGKVLWRYEAKPIGYEYFGFENCPLSLGVICDGKIYVYTTEHSPNTPLRRGSYIRCIDADTGKELWKILHWGSRPVISDGFLVDLNLYDNRIYCYGRGPSATTVTVSPSMISKGSSVLITGTVTDQSPGAKRLIQEGKFSAIPAVADECMQAWMEYVYMQQALPADIKGVEVTLDAVKQDGSYIHIGRVTTDKNGMFSYLWVPPDEGTYTIIATFEGSKSYWPSCASTALGVIAAPETSPPATAEQAKTTQAEVESLKVIIVGLLAMVTVCLCLVAYDIHINRKVLRRT